MHPADITAALRKAGTSQAEIARRLRVSPSAVCKVVAGCANARSRRIAKAVSRAAGIPMTAMWPSAYAKTRAPKRNQEQLAA